jgi:hypothetical protein
MGSLAFYNGEFVPVTDAGLEGQWSVVLFCPTQPGDRTRAPLPRAAAGATIAG